MKSSRRTATLSQSAVSSALSFETNSQQSTTRDKAGVRLVLLDNESTKPSAKKFEGKLHWRRLVLNTWLLETSTIIFSVTCLVAIAVVLGVYDGKTPPHMSYGVNLNAIVSVLASASKSSLLCAVAATLGQLKWCWFKEDQRLQDLQAFDDASRGPGGSSTFLFLTKPSLASIGALVTVLALAFDPFVQQVIQYPTRTYEDSGSSAIAGKASIFDVNAETDFNEFLASVNAGIWSDANQFDRTLPCPSGNCRWPVFRSLEWCSKCVDATPYATLIGACGSEEADGICRVSFGHGNKEILYNTNQSIWSMTGDAIWTVNFTNEPDYLWRNPATATPDYQFLGIRTPYLTFGYASLANGTNVIEGSAMASRIILSRAEECVLTPCTRDYEIEVVNGAPNVSVTSTNYGLFRYVNFHGNIERTCWQPDENEVIYSSRCDPNDPYWCISSNAQEYAFCPSPIYKDVLVKALTGKDYERFSNFTGNLQLNRHKLPSDVLNVVRAKGLDHVVGNLAASLTSLAVKHGNETVKGAVERSETYVLVRWAWLALPISLEAMGVTLLLGTVLYTYRRKAPLWKESLLPLLYHGLEELIVREPTSVSNLYGMEQSAMMTVVRLAPSKVDGRTVLEERSSPSIDPKL